MLRKTLDRKNLQECLLVPGLFFVIVGDLHDASERWVWLLLVMLIYVVYLLFAEASAHENRARVCSWEQIEAHLQHRKLGWAVLIIAASFLCWVAFQLRGI